jgi:hypothetical protein
MHAPAADRTVKRLSREEWFQRYDAADVLKREQREHGEQREAAQRNAPPADRVAVRA